MKKALVLFSGGLDSMLAARMLMNQSFEVTALSFASYFFDTQKAEISAQHLGIPIIVEDIAKIHLGVVKHPKFGYGAGLNPCIDCHALMIKKAWEVIQEQGFALLATGEVLGQRPMSQNKRALVEIEKATALQEKILRPLSAKLLSPTVYERESLVERDMLGDMQGRSRHQQLRLAKLWGITEFPTPAGGCRLTEKEFSQKLRNLLEKSHDTKASDFELIRFGRHFWENQDGNTFFHVILGRNLDENIKLEQFAEPGDMIVKKENEKGPTALMRNPAAKVPETLVATVKEMILTYSKNQPYDPNVGWTIRIY